MICQTLNMKCQKPGSYKIDFLCCPDDDLDLALPLFSGRFDSDCLKTYQYALEIQQHDNAYRMNPMDELEECMEVFCEQPFDLIINPDDRDKWVVGHFADKLTYSLIQSGMLQMQTEDITAEPLFIGQEWHEENESDEGCEDEYSITPSAFDSLDGFKIKECRLSDDPHAKFREKYIRSLEMDIQRMKLERGDDSMIKELEIMVEQLKNDWPKE